MILLTYHYDDCTRAVIAGIAFLLALYLLTRRALWSTKDDDHYPPHKL
jgi:hypothetical protein